MNLVDLVDENGLQQDDWSLTAPTFGGEGQLQVVGHDAGKGNKRFYILKCSKCSEDPELFGAGYFKSSKPGLMGNKIPCGCSKRPNWSKEQFATLCARKGEEIGYAFLGFVGDWKGQKTKIKMFCETHGEVTAGIINNLINGGKGCPSCNGGVLKPNDMMVTSFFASGAFHPQTKFWRSPRKTSRGKLPYWLMYCPECGETGESMSNDLQRGHRPCACSPMRQKECYINWIMDSLCAIAIKFGVANNSQARVMQQDKRSVYEITNHLVYIFPSVEACKKAERECKQKLECGIILKRDMPDGWTETTHIYNLDKVKQIYKEHGGIEV